MLKRLLISEETSYSIDETISLIRNGDTEKEEEFIAKYLPFIRKTTSTVCKRYIQVNHDDEFSIALIAFNEAIHQYSPDKGSSFLSFASLVIRRRIIDYIRQEQRRRVPLSMDYTEDSKENMENVAEVEASFKNYELSLEAEYRREEIQHLQEQLKTYKISLAEVAEQSPKHVDARENMLAIAKIIVKDDYFKEYLVEKKRIPVKELTERIEMSRKTIERNRKYLITLCLVLMEDYRYIQEYLKGWIS